MFRRIFMLAATFLFALPLFVFAETMSTTSQTTTSILPTLDEDARSQIYFDNLTDAQKKELKDFMNNNPIGPSLANPRVDAQVGTADCFDYYAFGSVQVDIEPTVGATVPGIPLTFVGMLKNANPYPLVDGQVMIKIFKIDGNDDSFVHQNGYPVVDQFFAAENVSLPAKGEKLISFEWAVPAFVESGDYEAVAFFMTAKRFNLLGLPFTDDVTGNKAGFKISSGEETGVSFDKNAVTLNGGQYRFASFPPHFTKDESVRAEMKLQNTTNKEQIVNVVWTLSNWAGEREENQLDQKTETIILKPKEIKSISYEMTKSVGAVSFLKVEEQYRDTKSILNIRFVRDGWDETRLNFPSIMGYPIAKGQKNGVFSCLHSTSAPIVSGGELILTLKDMDGNVIHTYDYQGSVTGAMMGVKDDFVPENTYVNFTLTATLKNQGKIVEELTETYACKDIDSALCPEEGKILPHKSGERTAGRRVLLYPIFAVLVILFGLLGWKLWKNKRGIRTKTLLLFSVIIVGATLFGGIFTAEAKSYSFNRSYSYLNLSYCWLSGSCNVVSPQRNSFGLLYTAWSPALNNFSVGIVYKAIVKNAGNGSVIEDGAIIPVGTHLKFEAVALQDTDISWVGTGYTEDSPYGHWVNGAYRPSGDPCNADDFVNSDPVEGMGYSLPMYIALSVNPPSVTFSHNSNSAAYSATLVCNATKDECEVTGPGNFRSTVTFSNTYGKFYYAYKNQSNVCVSNDYPLREESYSFLLGLEPISVVGLSDYSLSLNSRWIDFSFQAVEPNEVPTIPSIKGSADMVTSAPIAGLVSSPVNFYLRATDPDNDTVRYGVDWDGDGYSDQRVPAVSAGYVNSGVSQSVSKTWGSPGDYNIKVFAEDSKGGRSQWANHAITITWPPETSFLGTFGSQENQAVVTLPTGSGTVNLHWYVSNATGGSCTGYSATGVSGWSMTGTSNKAVSGNDNVFVSSTTEFYLDCWDGLGNSAIRKSVQVNVPPPPLSASVSVSPNPVPYGTKPNLTLSSTNATYCQLKLDSATPFKEGYFTSGTYPVPDAMTVSGAHTASAYCYDSNWVGSGWSTTSFTVSSPTLSATLSASPNSGTAPVNNVSLTATVGGTATGSINYKFDCTNDGTWEKTLDGSSANPYTQTNACSYATAGTYTAKVMVERNTAPAAYATVSIVVADPPSTLKICPNSCTGGGIPYNTLTSFSALPVTLHACYGTGSGCDATNAEVSGSWTANNTPADAISLSSTAGTTTIVTRTYSGTGSADEDITLSYNTAAPVTARAHAECIDSTDYCALGAASTCSGQTYTGSYTTTCGSTGTCSTAGTRFCGAGSSWKELAP